MVKEINNHNKIWVYLIINNLSMIFNNHPEWKINIIKLFKVSKKSATIHPLPPLESFMLPSLQVPRKNKKWNNLWTVYLKLLQLKRKFNLKSINLKRIQNISVLTLKKILENSLVKSEEKSLKDKMTKIFKNSQLRRRS